jgi:hypothetical protein
MGAKHRSRDTRTTSKPAGGLHPDGEKFIVDRYRTGMKNDMLCWRSFNLQNKMLSGKMERKRRGECDDVLTFG